MDHQQITVDHHQQQQLTADHQQQPQLTADHQQQQQLYQESHQDLLGNKRHLFLLCLPDSDPVFKSFVMPGLDIFIFERNTVRYLPYLRYHIDS